jgi:hypothetical protein
MNTETMKPDHGIDPGQGGGTSGIEKDFGVAPAYIPIYYTPWY